MLIPNPYTACTELISCIQHNSVHSAWPVTVLHTSWLHHSYGLMSTLTSVKYIFNVVQRHISLRIYCSIGASFCIQKWNARQCSLKLQTNTGFAKRGEDSFACCSARFTGRDLLQWHIFFQCDAPAIVVGLQSKTFQLALGWMSCAVTFWCRCSVVKKLHGRRLYLPSAGLSPQYGAHIHMHVLILRFSNIG